jgi:hypothetical protein
MIYYVTDGKRFFISQMFIEVKFIAQPQRGL